MVDTTKNLGGFGPAKQVTEEIQQIADKWRAQSESDIGRPFDQFKAVNYRTKVVAGTIFKIRVKTSEQNNEHADIQVFRPLPGQGEQEFQEIRLVDEVVEEVFATETEVVEEVKETVAVTKVGGFSVLKAVTQEVTLLTLSIKAQAEAAAGQSFAEWEAVSYKTKVVAGCFFKIRVRYGVDTFATVTVFRALSGEVEIKEVVLVDEFVTEEVVVIVEQVEEVQAPVKKLGGFGETKEITEEVTIIVLTLREKAEAQAGKAFDEWTPVQYKTKVVAGTFFKVRVRVAVEVYITLTFFRSLSQEIEYKEIILIDEFIVIEEVQVVQQPKLLGAYGGGKEATPEVQALIEAVRERAESDHGKAFEQWTAVSYKSQVVAGTNFKVKVKVADDKDGFSYAHVKVFRPLPGQGELELKELVDPQRLEDEL